MLSTPSPLSPIPARNHVTRQQDDTNSYTSIHQRAKGARESHSADTSAHGYRYALTVESCMLLQIKSTQHTEVPGNEATRQHLRFTATSRCGIDQPRDCHVWGDVSVIIEVIFQREGYTKHPAPNTKHSSWGRHGNITTAHVSRSRGQHDGSVVPTWCPV